MFNVSNHRKYLLVYKGLFRAQSGKGGTQYIVPRLGEYVMVIPWVVRLYVEIIHEL